MKPVTIYTTAWCPYCSAAKDLLTAKKVAFQEINIEGQPDLRRTMVARAGGRTSVPQIFVGETHVGGCDDLYALEDAARLDALLA